MVAIYVTGFVKRGLPHTSNSMNLEDCNLGFKAHKSCNFLYLLTYDGTLCCSNFKGMAVFNLKLLIGKLDVCGRPLFANPVSYIYICIKMIFENRYVVQCILFAFYLNYRLFKSSQFIGHIWTWVMLTCIINMAVATKMLYHCSSFTSHCMATCN